MNDNKVKINPGLLPPAKAYAVREGWQFNGKLPTGTVALESSKPFAMFLDGQSAMTFLTLSLNFTSDESGHATGCEGVVVANYPDGESSVISDALNLDAGRMFRECFEGA